MFLEGSPCVRSKKFSRICPRFSSSSRILCVSIRIEAPGHYYMTFSVWISEPHRLDDVLHEVLFLEKNKIWILKSFKKMQLYEFLNFNNIWNSYEDYMKAVWIGQRRMNSQLLGGMTLTVPGRTRPSDQGSHQNTPIIEPFYVSTVNNEVIHWASAASVTRLGKTWDEEAIC